MREKPVRFRKIEVRRAPGFEGEGFAVEDLSSGVNIIHGPNASGKTTLADSIAAALWPGLAPERSWIVGRFDFDGDTWRVEVEGKRGKYQRNGQDVSAPLMPAPDQSDRYRLSLHDLLQHETRNEAFAESVLRESAGGYDIGAAAEELGFRGRPSGSQIRESQEAERALENWNSVQQEVQELRDEERRLADLQRRLKEIKESRRRLDLINRAISYAEARDSYEDAKSQLQAFPAAMDRVSGDEIDRLQEIKHEIEDCEAKRQRAREQKAEAEAELHKVDLPAGGVGHELLTDVKERVDRAENLEKKLLDLDAQLERLRNRLEEERRKLGEEASAERLERIEQMAWGELSEFAHRAQKVLAEREALNELNRILRPDELPETDLETLRRAQRTLEDWLAAAGAEGDEGQWGKHLDLIVVGCLVVGAAGLGLFASPWLFMVGLLLISVFGAGILVYAGKREGRAEAGIRRQHEQRMKSLDLDGPSEWTAEAVRQRLDEILRARAEQEVAQKRQDVWENHSARFDDLEDAESRVREERAVLLEKFGIGPDTGAVELATLADHVSRWQDMHGELRAKEAERTKVQEQLDVQLGQVRDRLRPFGYDEAADSAEARGQILNLEERGNRFESASRRERDAQQTLDEAEKRLAKLEERRTALFNEVEVARGDTEKLRELCRLHEDYLERKTARQTAGAVVNQEKRKLEEHPAFSPELAQRNLTDLEQEAGELEEKTKEYEDVLQEVIGIQKEIERAKQRREVEEAMADRDRALEALAGKLEEDGDRMVGQVLVDWLRKESSETHRPEVFAGAREVLTTITRGRYRLDLVEGPDAGFRAYDTVKEKGLELDELSSATRLQVLLAVRIAFVQHQEDSVRLPLLLDETLANTDDAKAQVIIDSAIELAREGRQIFYFTAQGDEVARWKAALEKVGDVGHHVEDLAAAQGMKGQVEIPDLAEYAVEPPNVPAPEGLTHAEYGEKLTVPPFTPRGGAAGVHVWYVVRDVQLLYRLLRLGLKKWGQLKNVMETGDQSLISTDTAVLDRLRRNGRAIEAFTRAWSIGRGRLVDRDVLQESGAVSPKFIDEVSELAEQVEGDADAIIEALRDGEVGGFYSSKTDDLEEYFRENGYIDPADVLEPTEVRRRVIKSLFRSGLSQEEAAKRADELLERIRVGSEKNAR